MADAATRNETELTYTAVLTPGEDGWVCAQVAEVPEAISQGRTVEEAKANVTEALELALEWLRDEGEGIPERAQVPVTPVTVPAS
jgi:predicted RNase H-like HicB family nuclease